MLIIIAMSTQLLSAFNSYAFKHTTHLFISLLTRDDIHILLAAVDQNNIYQQLAHLLRARLYVLRLHQADRTLYFLHFESISIEDLAIERCNFLANNCHPSNLKKLLAKAERMERKGRQLLSEDYSKVEEALSMPDLPLPPIKRETIAPHCETVYQIALAFEKLKFSQQILLQMEKFNYSQITQYFLEALENQVTMIDTYLSSIADPFEHFAEITYRFMVYRNTILALHTICPFIKLSKTMQIWKEGLISHYQQSNKVFLEVAGFSGQKQNQFGRFTGKSLLDEGYLYDYSLGLIDLSVDENIVAFCGHSKQSFGKVYSQLEKLIVSSLRENYQIRTYSLQQIYQYIEQWSNMGLRPCTIRKIVEELHFDSIFRDESNYCRQDSYIETCARINGLLQPSNLSISCH